LKGALISFVERVELVALCVPLLGACGTAGVAGISLKGVGLISFEIAPSLFVERVEGGALQASKKLESFECVAA
jgi:hypothetical protein